MDRTQYKTLLSRTLGQIEAFKQRTIQVICLEIRLLAKNTSLGTVAEMLLSIWQIRTP